MASSDEIDSRAAKVAAVLGVATARRGPLTRVQSKRAGQLLDVRTTAYRLRQRFLANPVTSALDPQHRGPTPGGRRLKLRVARLDRGRLRRVGLTLRLWCNFNSSEKQRVCGDLIEQKELPSK